MSHWPQYTVVAVGILSLIISMANEGKPKTGTYQTGVMVGIIALNWWILWCGGFWEPILK